MGRAIHYKRLIVAPEQIRHRLVELIRGEIEIAASNGRSNGHGTAASGSASASNSAAGGNLAAGTTSNHVQTKSKAHIVMKNERFS